MPDFGSALWNKPPSGDTGEGSGGASDPVTRSLRFDIASTQKLTRTFGTPTSQKKVTISWWMKLAEQGGGSTGYGGIITAGDDGSNYAAIKVGGGATNPIIVDEVSGGAYKSDRQTSRAFRDTGAWMHCVHVIDTTDSTPDNRSKLYINGVRYTGPFATSYATYGQDYDTIWSKSGEVVNIGFDNSGGSPYFGGYLANIHYIDGQALAPSDFAETDSSTGQWVPKEYSGTYGNQGFHLDFKEDGATTSSNSGIGKDVSGNGNYFATTNLSSHDIMLDTPTKNYATLNPLDIKNTVSSASEGNLKLTGYFSTYYPRFTSTIAVNSGKWYWEVCKVGTSSSWANEAGVKGVNTPYPTGGFGLGGGSSFATYQELSLSSYDGNYRSGSGSTVSLGAWNSDEDIIGIALDLDSSTKTIQFYKNGSALGSAQNIPAGDYTWTPAFDCTPSSGTNELRVNYGQDNTFAGKITSGQDTSQSEFFYAPPTGFKSLNTSNLDAPTVTPSENFNSLVYQGASPSDKAVTGVGFQPDLVWIKARTQSYNHAIYDSVRGATKELHSNTTNTEDTDSNGLKTFDSDGFTVGSDGEVGDPTGTRISWNWKAHQSPSSGSSSTTTYTVKVEDNSGDAWDAYGNYVDYSTYFPSVYMEIFENRNSSLVSLGKVAVRYYDSSGNNMSDTSEQTYTLECADLNAIAVKWHYDTSGDGQEYDYPNYYNDYLNDQKITILDGTTSEWTTNNYSNDDGTSSNYSPPTGWADGDTLKSATTSYNGSDTATLTSDSGASDPVEKYNAAAGFTIISYSGDGSTSGDTQELDHSLGVPLEFVIAKARTNNDSYDNGDWIVYHKDLTSNDYLMLNSTAAADTPYEGYDIISTSVSGSQHKVVVGNDYDSGASYGHYLNSGPSNGTGEDYILYGWAGVEGYSKFGKYTGGSDPFIYTGFKVGFWMVKRIDSTGHWTMFDSARDTDNPVDHQLEPNYSNPESPNSTKGGDFLSNGFKVRSSQNEVNASGGTYIYAAFAESPFKHANAR